MSARLDEIEARIKAALDMAEHERACVWDGEIERCSCGHASAPADLAALLRVARALHAQIATGGGPNLDPEVLAAFAAL